MQLLFHIKIFCMATYYLNTPYPVERETISKLIQIKKIQISGRIGLQNPDPVYHWYIIQSEMSIGQRWVDIDIWTPGPYPKTFLHVNIQSFSENFRNLVSDIHPYPIAALAKYHWCSRNRNLRDLAETSRPRLCHKSRDLKARDRDPTFLWW